MAERETEELVAKHPELTESEKAELRATGKAVSKVGAGKVIAAQGHAYATSMTLSDLRLLAAFTRSPAASRQRQVQPKIIAATMTSLAGADFKKDVSKQFCSIAHKLCETD